MKTQETKLMIIENYIDHFTSDEKERESMKESAVIYVNEDHVDEITQANIEINFTNTPSEDWAETHYEITYHINSVAQVIDEEYYETHPLREKYYDIGMGLWWKLAYEWTNEFMATYPDQDFPEGNWLEVVENFGSEKINNYKY